MKTNEFHGLRWTSITDASSCRASQAWTLGNEHNPHIEAVAGTEIEALDSLRSAICKHYRKSDGAVKNERGDTIIPGGGYR